MILPFGKRWQQLRAYIQVHPGKVVKRDPNAAAALPRDFPREKERERAFIRIKLDVA